MNAKKALEKTKDNSFTLERIYELITDACEKGEWQIQIPNKDYVDKSIKDHLVGEGYQMMESAERGIVYLFIAWF